MRAAMRDQNRTDWQRFYSAGLYIDPKDPRTLIIKPKDSEFKSVLDAAGVPELDLASITTDTDNEKLGPPEEQNSIEKFLADLKNLRN